MSIPWYVRSLGIYFGSKNATRSISMLLDLLFDDMNLFMLDEPTMEVISFSCFA